jgi:hypothetical protein
VPNGIVRDTARSMFQYFGPTAMCRSRSPKVPGAGCANAALSVGAGLRLVHFGGGRVVQAPMPDVRWWTSLTAAIVRLEVGRVLG